MKTKLMALLLLAGGAMFGGVVVGVGVGIPVPGPVAVAPVILPCPGPGYVWANGVWTLAPFAGALWVGPSYISGRFVAGYWGGHPGYVRGGGYARFRR